MQAQIHFSKVSMKKLVLLASMVLLAACTKPTDIVFGPEPLKQMAEQGEQFKKLPEEDRQALVAYIEYKRAMDSVGEPMKDTKSITGRTAGEVLAVARPWVAEVHLEQIARKKKVAEAEALKAKVLAERKLVMDKLGEAVTVAVTGKKILPENFQARRIYDELQLTFAVDNKSDKAIRQLKGILHVFDATGTEVGVLRIDFSELIKAKTLVKTSTGYVWEVRRFKQGNIEKIADAQFEGMTTRFDVEVIAYADGEIIKAADDTDGK